MSQDWFKKAIIYQILIDRFSGADISENIPDFMGGNLQGIIARIDYLSELGVNTIWLSPFCKTDRYHGYHIIDYKSVDPHFGSFNDLQELITRAHDKSLRVITDFVPNHCSDKHPFFIEAQRDRKSKYFNWFYFKNWPDNYLCFMNFRELPKLNLENHEARDYIVEVAKYWLSEGVDGYRIDHVIGPSHNFWKHFYTEIKSSYTDCVLFGEAWGEGIDPKYFETFNVNWRLFRKAFGMSQESLQREYYKELDGVLDFKLQDIIVKNLSRGNGFTSSVLFREEVRRHFSRYPDNFQLVTFLDNHDMNRFLFYCNGNSELLLEALEFLFSTGKPVVIYYGTEMGMSNVTSVTVNESNTDLVVREPVDWSIIDYLLYSKVKDLIKKYSHPPI
jgi:glycosidase